MRLTRHLKRSLRWGLLPLVGLAIGAVAITAANAHQGPVASGVIHGCVTKTGDLKVISATATCAANEQPLDWNAQGAPGVSGRVMVRQEVPASTETFKQANVMCPAGTKVLGGGYDHNAGETVTVTSFPRIEFDDFAPSGWIARARLIPGQPTTATWHLVAFAICAKVQ